MKRLDEFVLIKYRGALEPIMVPPQQAATAIGAGVAVPVTLESRPDLAQRQ